MNMKSIAAAALATMLLFATTSPALASLGFVKTTINNASGNQTPNCLVYGWFEYNLTDDMEILPPTNAASGQFIMITIHDDTTHVVTWDYDYKWPGELSGFGTWQGLFFYDAGEIRLVYGNSY